MRQYYCKVCKQTFQSESMPQRCPICGAGKEALEEVVEGPKPPMPTYYCKVCKQTFESASMPDRCPICRAGKEALEEVKEEPKPAMKKYYCKVCKQTFESETMPERCPICGVGQDAMVEVIGQSSAFTHDSDAHYLIIGTGVAGLNCAKAIRERDRTAVITMVGTEEKYPYNRPGLSAFVAGEEKYNTLILEKPDYYDKHHIQVKCGVSAVAIDKENKAVTLSSGETLNYDKLCIASGAVAFNPYQPQEGKIPVYSLRTLKDAETIIAALHGKNVFIVGGGILGLEAAMALKKQDCQVSVADVCDTPLCLQADAFAGALLKDDLSQAGFAVYMHNTVQTLETNGVTLKDGSFVACDAVLAAIGVRSDTALARAAGIEVNRGIVVNEHGETSEKDIYACGDCAEFQGQPGGQWQIAVLQGAAAGAAMAGDPHAAYVPDVPALIFHGPSLSLFSAGVVTGELESVSRKSPDGRAYRFLAFKDGRLCGAVLVGALAQSAKALDLIKAGAAMKEAVSLLL